MTKEQWLDMYRRVHPDPDVDSAMRDAWDAALRFATATRQLGVHGKHGKHVDNLERTLRVIYTWSLTPGAFVPEHVRKIIDETLHTVARPREDDI